MEQPRPPQEPTTAPPPAAAAAADESALLGLDNVRLDLPLAGVGSRTLAASLDHLLLILFQTLWVLGAAAGFSLLGLSEGVGFGWLAAILLAGFFLLQWGYFAAFEIALGGKTPGKLAVGLRVVSHRGGRTTAAACLIRNFLRNFDILIGLPIMAFDRRARRLGDLVAGTLVVHDRELAGEEVQLRRHPEGWGVREVALVEAFLRRAPYLEPQRAQELAERLLRFVAAHDGSQRAEMAPMLATSVDRVAVLRRIIGADADVG